MALVGSADLATSPRVQVQAGAELDASARTGGGYSVAATRTLDVSGSVVGNTSNASGGTIAIGGDGAATIGPRTVRFTPPNGATGSNSDVRVRSGSGANANQNDTQALGLGSISATDTFRSLLTFDLASTGITDPNYINSVALTLTLQAPNGAQVNTTSAPQFELLTIQPYNSDTVTFNTASFATTATPPAQPPAALISTTTGPNFTNYVAGATMGWSQATSGAFVDAVKGKLGSSLNLGARLAGTSPGTRSFYFVEHGETTTPNGAPSLAITYTDPNNPFVTGVGSAVFEGNLTTAAGSTLEIDVFNTSLFDSVDVNGTATLSGILSVDALDLSRLAVNDTFTILTANSIVNNLTLGGPDGALFNLSSSTPTSLVLRYTGAVASQSGDFNGDGRVDGGDLSLLLANWGSTVPPNPSGWTGNLPTAPGIDADELSRLLANWGFGTSTAIPEPCTAVLMLVASMGVFGSRRR